MTTKPLSSGKYHLVFLTHFLFTRFCSVVLQDYINKETHLLQIKQEKLEIAQSSQAETDDGEVRDVQPQSQQKDIKPLEIQEGILVRQIQSLTPIIQKQILFNFQ